MVTGIEITAGVVLYSLAAMALGRHLRGRGRDHWRG